MNESMNFFSCYIISETSLGLQCAQVLTNEGNQLLGIISNHYDTCKWAKQNNIPVISTIAEFQVLNPNQTFDYLFSIVNSHILSNSVLQLPRFCAINYHDSPLPKYAGANATSWALLNNEKTHGVSWHGMEKTDETGSIFKQLIFPIREDETVLSLNLECYIHALESFKDLIKDLEQNNATILLGTEQDIKDKSYFARHQKPSNLGFVSWYDSAENIERQFRALYFGDYLNTLTSFKVLIGDQIFIPTELKILNIQSDDIAGTVINITDKSIQISTDTQDIALISFKTTKGQPITIQKIEQLSSLEPGYRFQSLSVKIIKELYKLSNDLSCSEAFWTSSILSSVQTTLPFTHQVTSIDEVKVNKEDKTKNKKKKHTQIIISKEQFFLYSKRYHDIHDVSENNYSFVEVLLTAFIIYLNRIGNASSFSLGFVNSFLQALPKTLQPFFPKYVPLTCLVLSNMTILDLMSYIQNQVIAVEGSKAYFNDLLVRLPNIGSTYTELPVVIKIKDNPQIEDNGGEMNEEEDVDEEENKEVTKLDDVVLVFNIDKTNNTCVIEIAESLIEGSLNDTTRALINVLPEHLEMLVQQIIDNPYQTVDTISFLTSPEKHQLLIDWNDTKTDYPEVRNKTITQLFEEQVERTPDNIAVVYTGLELTQELTYKQLNEKANQLAHYLRSLGVGPDTLVAIVVERSLEMIIGLLGILKAGGAYVPLDPDYPQERLQYMLDDTGAKVFITQGHLQEKLKQTLAAYRGMVVVVDQVDQLDLVSLVDKVGYPGSMCGGTVFSQQSIENPVSCTLPHHLAYVIYTSGSTGRPKGVMVEHRSIINYMVWMKEAYEFSVNDIILQRANYTFDASVWEIMIPILSGGQLILPSSNTNKDIRDLGYLVPMQGITTLQLVPSLLKIFLKTQNIQNLKQLKRLFIGGEKFPVETTSLWNNTLQTKLINLYGPTEASIYATHYSYYAQGCKSMVPIGRPISNTQIYILDSCMNPVPVGIAGEIYIGGAGLARGYLNRADLTAEKFVPNPFTKENHDTESEIREHLRLYRTGDLARFLPDGNIEFLGRIDDQVKIRGFRIEPGEIENVLSSYKGIKQSVVLAFERKKPVDTNAAVHTDTISTGNKYLVAYYVKELDKKIHTQKIQILLERCMKYIKHNIHH